MARAEHARSLLDDETSPGSVMDASLLRLLDFMYKADGSLEDFFQLENLSSCFL